MLRLLRVLVVLLLGGSVAGLAIVDAPETTVGPTPPSTSTTFPLTPGRARVTGTLTAAIATGAGGDPVLPPFTIAVPEAGQGGLTLPGVTVDRRTQTIEWTGGRPLPVTGSGPGLDAKPARVSIDLATITWFLDGAPRAFLGGPYQLGSAVAVGGEGLAAPRDTVAFLAPLTGAAFTTRGGAVAQVPARKLRIESPDGTLELSGQLTIETTTVTRPLPTLRFGPGRYVVELTPVPGGYAINAALEGAVTG